MYFLVNSVLLAAVVVLLEGQVTHAYGKYDGYDGFDYNDYEPDYSISHSEGCMKTYQRPKRVYDEQCIDNKICKVYSLSTSEFETKDFRGWNECYVVNARRTFTSCTGCVAYAVSYGTLEEREELNNWLNDESVPETTCTDEHCGAGSVGDPHFITFDGFYYNYHGECDLVLAESTRFGNGKGLDVHIRTTIEKLYSYISAAAIRIGNDTLEVDSDGKGYFNGVREVPALLADYPVSTSTSCSEEAFHIHKKVANQADASICEHPTTRFTIELPKGESISISATEGMLKVDISTLPEDAAGMAGTVGKNGMVARDGNTVFTNPKEMGANWQVNSTQVHLFREQRAPQHPQGCKLPDYSAAQTSRRLGQNLALQKMATNACASVEDKNMRMACEFDVVQTQNVDMAITYRL